jgi:lysophospholipid acyltransferase (LPLAT)-like uncharacterized protein
VKLIYWTNKKVYHYPTPMDSENFIFLFGMEIYLLQPLNYKSFKKNGLVKVIVSEHSDGEIIRRTVEH